MILIDSEYKTIYKDDRGKIKAYFVSPDIQMTIENIKKVLEKLSIKKCKEYIANDK